MVPNITKPDTYKGVKPICLASFGFVSKITYEMLMVIIGSSANNIAAPHINGDLDVMYDQIKLNIGTVITM